MVQLLNTMKEYMTLNLLKIDLKNVMQTEVNQSQKKQKKIKKINNLTNMPMRMTARQGI